MLHGTGNLRLAGLMAALGLLGLWVAGCGSQGGEPSAGGGATPRLEKSTESFTYQGKGPVRVVVTTGMVADLVRAVGGDRVEVQQLLGSGVDPHLYKVSRDDVSAISRADLVVYSGLLLEGKMDDTFRKLALNQPVWAVAAALPASELLLPEDVAAAEGNSAEGHVDPHVWMDVSLWARCLKAFAERLGDFDPSHRAQYVRNAAAAEKRWLQLHAEGSREIAGIPAENRVLVTSHDAFGYFGRAYGIEVQGVQGISTESEAGLQQVNQLVDLLVQRKLRAVFVESSVPRKSIEAIVAGAATRGQIVEIAGPLYADAMGEPGTEVGTYEGMMRHNFSLIVKALKAGR